MSTENTNLHPRDIVSAYADLLATINENEEPEPLKLIPLALPESLLPFPSKAIRHTLAIYLLHQNYKEQRGSTLGAKYIMTHLGSSKGVDRKKAVNMIIEGLEKIIDSTSFSAQLLLENTAGQGATMGDSFEELAEILDGVKGPEIGICIDTAHLFASGYDIRTEEKLKETFYKISTTIGIEKIKLFHGNDSKVDLGERKDRHEHIGKGKIGIKGFENIIKNTDFENINMVVETPPEKVGDDIETLKNLRDKEEKYPP